MKYDIQPSGVERSFDARDIIVSKTNLKGHITYANSIFQDLSGYTEKEILGQPHAMVRHPDMPRAIFKLLWDTIQSGREIFAYVVNISKNGDHYWVLAHVTPSFDADGQISGYHSNRRVPNRKSLDSVVRPLYKTLLDIENRPENRKDNLKESSQALTGILGEKGVAYDEFIFSLES